MIAMRIVEPDGRVTKYETTFASFAIPTQKNIVVYIKDDHVTFMDQDMVTDLNTVMRRLDRDNEFLVPFQMNIKVHIKAHQQIIIEDMNHGLNVQAVATIL